MSQKFSEELLDDQIRYKYFNFQKLNPHNGLKQKSSTKFKSVRTTSCKKIVAPEPIDLSDTIYANSKFMTKEMPKYVDADNSKNFFRRFTYNLNLEIDDESTAKVNKNETEKSSKKVSNAEQSKMKPSKLKSKILKTNSNRNVKNTPKSHTTKNGKNKENTYIKPVKKTKSSVENLRRDAGQKPMNTKQQSLYEYYDEKAIRVIKKPKSIDRFEPNGKCGSASHMEKQINGYIEKLIRKFEDPSNTQPSPYMLPKRRNRVNNYKSKTTIVTPAGTNESFSKICPDKKNLQQNETSVRAKAKLLNAALHNPKQSFKNTVAHLSPKTASKTEQDNYLPYTSPPLIKSKDFSKTRDVWIKSKTTSKTEQNQENRNHFPPCVSPTKQSKNILAGKEDRIPSKTARNETVRDDLLPYTSPPITKPKNILKGKEDRIPPKTTRNETVRDDFLPYTSPPITKSKNILKGKENRIPSKTERNEIIQDDVLPCTSPTITKSKIILKNMIDRISSRTERNEIIRDDYLPYRCTSPPLTSNGSANQNFVRKTSSTSVLPEKKKSLPKGSKSSEKKVSKSKIKELSKIIVTEAISHAIEKTSSDTKCSEVRQGNLSKIKELIKDIANEEIPQVIENRTSDSKNLSVNKMQICQIKELIEIIANQGSLQTNENSPSSAKCIPVPENKESNNKIKIASQVAAKNVDQSNMKDKCTLRDLMVSSTPKRPLVIKRNRNIVEEHLPITTTSWTSLVAAHSILDITKINHRMPKSYVYSKYPKTTLKNFKKTQNFVQAKTSSITFILSYKSTPFHISSSIFHTSVSVPSIKNIKPSPNNNDVILKSNSQDAIKLFKLNQTLESKEGTQPSHLDFSSVVELFATDKKLNNESLNENKRHTESKNLDKKKPKRKCCGHKTVVLCQRRPEYWWVRAHQRNGTRNAKRCNCDYCKTMSKYLPQIENSATSITASSEISTNGSSETISLDVDSFPMAISSYENLVKIDPLYTKLMADTEQNKLAQLLKYEPHSCCYSSNCEKCRNTLRSIAYCRTNRSETDLNLISKLKDHQHEINNSNPMRSGFDIKRSAEARRNIFRKIKISTTRIITKNKQVEKMDVKKIAIETISEKKEPPLSPKMPFQCNVSIPKKPALKGGDMKLMDSQNITSAVLIKRKNRESSMTIFSELRNVLTMFASFNFKILDFITFGKLNVFRR